MHEMNLLSAQGLSKSYAVDGRTITVLADVSLTVDEGERLVVTGSSGSGKTTLLSLLSGLDRPSRGTVRFLGEDITHAPEDGLARLRNQAIGFVFQAFHLVPSLTALENVMFPAELAADPEARPKAESLLERVGLTHRLSSLPHQLSGGEKQRVAVCRALINRPRVVFADEPTGNLDSENSRAILDLLRDLHRAHGTTLVLVTHDRGLSASADRVLNLRDGRLDPVPTHAA
jgi:putative ABC transport system ATP-binding protein